MKAVDEGQRKERFGLGRKLATKGHTGGRGRKVGGCVRERKRSERRAGGKGLRRLPVYLTKRASAARRSALKEVEAEGRGEGKGTATGRAQTARVDGGGVGG